MTLIYGNTHSFYDRPYFNDTIYSQAGNSVVVLEINRGVKSCETMRNSCVSGAVWRVLSGGISSHEVVRVRKWKVNCAFSSHLRKIIMANFRVNFE